MTKTDDAKMTVGGMMRELKEMIEAGKIDADTIVQSEGCDCIDDASGVEVSSWTDYTEAGERIESKRLLIRR